MSGWKYSALLTHSREEGGMSGAVTHPNAGEWVHIVKMKCEWWEDESARPEKAAGRSAEHAAPPTHDIVIGRPNKHIQTTC
jgi:hypothetical protein